MDFTSFSNKYVPIVEAKIQDYLKFDIKDQRKVLIDAMNHSLAAKGKRIRPLLSIATFLMFSDNLEKVMPLACAIEMIHTYSLIHDDLPAMDNDNYRRGQLTCHKKFGEDIAILAGDTLNSLAVEIICDAMPEHYSADKILQIITIFAHACGIYGMAGLVGEILRAQPGAPLDIEIVPGVTSLLSAAALLGAPISGDFACISLSDYLIPWQDIQGAYVKSALGNDFICLSLTRPEKYLGQLGSAKRSMVSANEALGFTPFSLNLSGLDVDTSQVFELVMKKCEEAKR